MKTVTIPHPETHHLYPFDMRLRKVKGLDCGFLIGPSNVQPLNRSTFQIPFSPFRVFQDLQLWAKSANQILSVNPAGGLPIKSVLVPSSSPPRATLTARRPFLRRPGREVLRAVLANCIYHVVSAWWDAVTL